MKFKNPTNGYIVRVSPLCWLWVLLFGGIYFAVNGVWKHFIAGILLAVPTVGISWLLYPFFTPGIMRHHYLSQGWEQVR